MHPPGITTYFVPEPPWEVAIQPQPQPQPVTLSKQASVESFMYSPKSQNTNNTLHKQFSPVSHTRVDGLAPGLQPHV